MNLEQKIYKKLLEVPPRAKITTYGELSKAVGLKNGQRAVGKIMNKNPYPVIFHVIRVVMSTGKDWWLCIWRTYQNKNAK